MLKSADSYYQSFLIRCWLVPALTAQEPPLWRFEIQYTTAGSPVYRFNSLEQVHVFTSNELAKIAAQQNMLSDEMP